MSPEKRKFRFKIYILFIVLTLLAYGNTLNNDFIGDDNFLFIGNEFYDHPSNLAKIFSRDFITPVGKDAYQVSPSRLLSYSGCVSYRPVTAITFFLDAFLWKKNPFGYHLSNLILHLLVVFGLFSFVNLVLANEKQASLAAMIFAVHPVFAELINNIGYRSDLLCTFFYLFSLTALIRYSQKPSGKFLLLGGLLSFMAALFSKEVAVTLPAILIVYHLYFRQQRSFKEIFQKHKYLYGGLISILLFYLFIYFFVFPNSHLNQLGEFSLLGQGIAALKIFLRYASALILPFKVGVLPSFYSPSSYGVNLFGGILILALTLSLIYFSFKGIVKKNPVSFFMLWAFITYLPVSNIFPMPNPFAYRLLYLPSVGLAVVAAYGIDKIIDLTSRQNVHLNFSLIIKILVIGYLLIFTPPLNVYYSSNTRFYSRMIKDYPDCAYPYLVLATLRREAGRFQEAVFLFKQYLANAKKSPYAQLMPPDHEIYVQIGTSYAGDPERSIQYFKEALKIKPDYANAFAQMAKANLIKKDYKASLALSLRSIELKEDLFVGYVYGLEAYLALGQFNQAGGLLQQARFLFPNEKIFIDIGRQLREYRGMN